MSWIVALSVGLLFSITASAQESQPTTLPSDEVQAPPPAEEPNDLISPLTLKQQAALEAQIGLRLYAEGEDYRAITAMHRYRILSGTPDAAFLAHLVTGEIYRRNQKPRAAQKAFASATQFAEDAHSKNLSFLMANQESCIGLSHYFACAEELDAFLSQPLGDATRQLAGYQRLYVDVVLRSDTVSGGRVTGFRDPVLRAKAAELVQKSADFEDLPTKSPWVAGFLSIVPGAGQLYNGRPVDALLAFGLTSGFGVISYLSFAEWDSVPFGVATGIIALSFYAGNIVNAVTDANRITANAYLSFFEELQRSHWARVKFEIVQDRVSFGYTFDLEPTRDSGPELK